MHLASNPEARLDMSHTSLQTIALLDMTGRLMTKTLMDPLDLQTY